MSPNDKSRFDSQQSIAIFPFRDTRCWLVLGLILIVPAVGGAAGIQPPQPVAVSKAFDNAQFSYRIELVAEKNAFLVYRLSYPSPVRTAVEQNNIIPAELYLPKDIRAGGPRRPAVICLHILDGNVELVQVACSALATRGVPALWFNLPYYGERSLPGGRRAMLADPEHFATAIAQAVEDVRRSIDVLASRPEIDPQRVGVMGISLGGILAATAAENDPRIARATLILGGGDLLPVVHQARETRELSAMIHGLPPDRRAQVETMIQEVDPLRHAERLRERAQAGKVLMINAANDEVIPRACTQKLATALGMPDRIIWFDGLGHYTMMAALPQVLRTTVAFFAQDLPPGVKPSESSPGPSSPQRTVVTLLQQCGELLVAEPKEGRCHFVHFEVSATGKDGKKIEGRAWLIRGPKPKFSMRCQLPGLGEALLGYGVYPWMVSEQRVVFKGRGAGVSPADSPGGDILAAGEGSQAVCIATPADPLAYAEPRHLLKLQVLSGALGTLAIAPDMLNRWVTITDDPAADKTPAIRIIRKDRPEDYIRLALHEDGAMPRSATFDVDGVRGTVVFHAWQFNTVAHDSMFQEPAGLPSKEVDPSDLVRMFSAMFNFVADSLEETSRVPVGKGIEVISRDPAGHGILCRSQGKTILMVAGTPDEMGTAHGTLLREPIRKLCERVLYLVGGGDSFHWSRWAFDRFAEIERRTLPHLPERFLAECDALARAAGVSQRDGRAANLFPERFHCSGLAVRGKATVEGKVLHARVLDYMRDVRLQDAATVTVFMPQGRHKWVTQGYAGFIGTVTAMNEKGLAVGEMGGQGEGDWDGVPMSFLLRDLMERAATVDQALEILRRTPRTCEYYYVLSDRSRTMAAVHCSARQMTVLRPGQQDLRLPHVPQDTVLISGPDRVALLSERLQKHYGKIDVPTLIEIIKRPVAMDSNLHDAILAAETLDLWVADAGASTPACDEPYAHFNLHELIRFYESVGTTPDRVVPR
jgi:dienelactone hydrolase